MAAKTFNLKKLYALFNGQRITGAPDGDFVTIEADGNRSETVVGADGETMRSIQNRPGGTITFVVQYGSPAVAIFEQHRTDDAEGEEPATIRIATEDGSYSADANVAWLEVDPSPAFSRQAGDLTYVFRCADLNQFFGPMPVRT